LNELVYYLFAEEEVAEVIEGALGCTVAEAGYAYSTFEQC
jgi:hypothetical protein